MLAQNFMPAEALGITEEQQGALIKTLGVFERGEVVEGKFSMLHRHCGTVHCLLGWADTLAPAAFPPGWTTEAPDGVKALFLPNFYGCTPARFCRDPAKGAHALRNYLTTGDAQWDAVMAESTKE